MSAVLDVFDAPRCRRGLTEIADRTGLPVSTTHRILDQLADLGWVEHQPDGYRLGPRPRLLCERVDPTAALREAAAPHIEQFVRRTPFVVHLAVLDGPNVRYLDKAGGPTAVRVPSRVGGLLPAHLTAIGKAMLAYVPHEALEQTLDEAATGRAVVPIDLAAIHRELAGVRSRGVATDRSSSLASVVCVGAPIFGADDEIVGALSLCHSGSGEPLSRFAAVVRERARRISARMSVVAATG